MGGMTVGLALIAKNEEYRLPTLLASIEGAFDQVVLVDTGSSDGTKQVFDAWASAQGDSEHPFSYTIEDFEWVHDFSAARTYADSLLTTDWLVWADCDDEIIGAQNIRGLIASAPPEVSAFVCNYNYAQHPATGQCICTLKRERIVRTGKGVWQNRVHEAQVVEGGAQFVEPTVIEWKHRKVAENQDEVFESGDRNLEILESWILDEPENTRVLAYLGTEKAMKGRMEEAKAHYVRYLEVDRGGWPEERAQVLRRLASCHMGEGDIDTAVSLAMTGLELLPQWPDNYLTMAEAHHARGEHEKSIEWAREVLRRGIPDTLLIINPLDYTFQAKKVLAGSLALLGRVDEALAIGQEAWQENPMDQDLAHAMTGWRQTAKREHTANTFGMMFDQLVAHDEQLKARNLLACVPHFIEDHPRIVGARTLISQRLAWVDDPTKFEDHYATGGSKPEDFLPLDQVDAVCERLPRVSFLLDGLREQLGIEATLDGAMEEMLGAAGVLGA